MIDLIREEMEKLFSTVAGVLLSLLFGGMVAESVSPPDMSPILLYLVEMVSKVGIAVVSGCATYLAIYGIKKALKHDDKK